MIQSIRDGLPKLFTIIRAYFVIMWLGVLSGTDSLFSIYGLCAVVCIFCLLDNWRHNRYISQCRVSVIMFCCIFSAMVFLANYNQFTIIWYMDSITYPTNILKNGLNAINCLIGGFVIASEIVIYSIDHFPVSLQCAKYLSTPGKVFAFVFFSVLIIDLLYLFFDEYPGHLSADAIYQIRQGYTNWYMNDHPFWNTMYIKFVLRIGYLLFGSSNGAVALYSVLQILMVAAAFAYTVMTMYQIGFSRWILLFTYCIYVFLPYNIVYSISMFKDVVFSLAVLVSIVSLYRLYREIGYSQKLDYAVFTTGAVSICFSRTNGLPILLLFAAFLLRYMLKSNRKLLIIFILVCLIAGILCGPVLTLLGVRSSEVTEPFSLPLQQMARVVCDGCELTESQEVLLSRIFDLDNLSDVYISWYADPIKREVRSNDNSYFAKHLGDYVKLWFEVGLKYPLSYLKAWIDQTKGYWNGGYSYYQYVEELSENSYGFYKVGRHNIVAKLFDIYFAFTRQSMLFEPLHSIGLHVWITALCFFLNWRKKNFERYLFVPLIIIVLGLWIGTPVYAEFRYAYPLFITCPFLLPITLYRTTDR